jgi:hypothetical protein
VESLDTWDNQSYHHQSCQKKSTKLWNGFLELKYPTSSDKGRQILSKPKLNTNPEESWAMVFSSIARLYKLADYYDIKDLVAETLRRMHEALTVFILHESRV